MNTTTPALKIATRPPGIFDPAELIPASLVAERFGYADVKHFRTRIAPGIGLVGRKQCNRWFFPCSEVERATAALLGTARTIAATAEACAAPPAGVVAMTPAAEVAKRFGYRPGPHFRRVASVRLGLTPVTLGSRTFYPKQAVDLLISGMVAAHATAAAPAS